MSEQVKGRVIRSDARVCHVDIEGEVRQCALRGRLFEELDAGVKSPVAVGDWVLVGLEGDPPGIEEVLPRANYLSRVASSHDPREQVLFSNVDHMFVVGSVKKPGFSSNRADRILAACLWHDIKASLILNKVDLDKDDNALAIRETYQKAGIEVLDTSATEQQGIEELRERLKGRVSVFYGASGVGKSTLLNALQPGLGLKVGKISRYWAAGKHTTSYSQMHRLDSGGWVIDTPGIRVFRLHGLTKPHLRDLFPEFLPFQDRCRFPDCTHDHEPECGVFEAVERGKIAPTRFASYIEMLDEVLPPPEEDVAVGEEE